MQTELGDILNALRRIVRAIRRSSTDVEKTLGITGAQLFVLHELAAESPLSVNELAARTLTDQSSVSVVIARLCERKLVSRKPSKTDARRVELSLTSTGKKLLRKAPELAQTKLIAALRHVPKTKLRATKHVLEEVATALGSEEPAMFFERE